MVYVDFHVTGSLFEPASLERFVSYGGGGTPTTWVDGTERLIGGMDAATRYRAAYEAALQDSGVVEVSVEATFESVSRRISATTRIVNAEEVLRPEECLVRAVLFEDGVRSRGRTFDRTVRAVFPSTPLAGGGAGATTVVTETVVIEEGWDPEQLRVVAWVQSPEGDVLNAGQSAAPLVAPTVRSSWGAIKALWR